MMRLPDSVTDLPEGRIECDLVRADGVTVHSLTGHALCAIDRHKWIESQKSGRDLGYRRSKTGLNAIGRAGRARS
jgi:hypothetical protein